MIDMREYDYRLTDSQVHVRSRSHSQALTGTHHQKAWLVNRMDTADTLPLMCVSFIFLLYPPHLRSPVSR